MKEGIQPGDKIDMESFVTYYMSHYSMENFEVGTPYTRYAYGKPYLIKELNNAYKVTVNGITKRFSSLCYVAEFLFKQLYNPKHVYLIDTPYKRIKELREMRLATARL
jgi:hypothetical protein